MSKYSTDTTESGGHCFCQRRLQVVEVESAVRDSCVPNQQHALSLLFMLPSVTVSAAVAKAAGAGGGGEGGSTTRYQSVAPPRVLFPTPFWHPLSYTNGLLPRRFEISVSRHQCGRKASPSSDRIVRGCCPKVHCQR